MQRRKEQIIKKKYNKRQLIIICLLGICTISIVFVFGRYVVNNIKNSYTKSKEFYFNSDKLDANNPSYQINNWSGVDDYLITINMNSRENNLLTSSYDIDYEISYISSNNVICQLSKTTGTIYSNTNTDFFNLIIIPNTTLNTGDKVFVEIQAKANEPYQKTIKARFTLQVGKENLSYEIVDKYNNPYLQLKITNTLSYYIVRERFDNYTVGDKITEEIYLTLSKDNRQKCHSAIVTLNFDPNYVLLDMTNTNYLNAISITNIIKDSYNYINGLTFSMEASSSVTIRFYKIDVLLDYTYPNVDNEPIINVTSM